MDALRDLCSQPALRLRRAEPWILGALLVGAITAVLALKPLLYRDNHALGSHASALFVPFMAGLAMLLYHHLSRDRMEWRALAPLVVCMLLSTLFLDAFLQPIEHYRGDDPWRYSLYAHEMLEHGTLWGSPSAYYGADTRHFVEQPGYRYFLAGMIWLCGGENRIMQLLILLLVLALLPFIRQNLLLAVPALAVLQIAATRRYGLVVPFILVFLLPLYHNLYYAGEMKLLADNKGAMLDLSAPLHNTIIDAVRMVAAKLITHVGIPVDRVDLHTIAAALLFAPASLFGMLYFVLYRPASPPWLCRGVLALLIGPTLFFGYAYFPRFVYVNYTVGFLSLVALARLFPEPSGGPGRPDPGR